MRTLLVSMPFGPLDRPALGISLLKPIVAAAGIRCDIAYLNLAFARLVGFGEYRWISTELPYTAFAGDWTFTDALYGLRSSADAVYVQQILRGEWHLSDDVVSGILRIRCFAAPFLDYCINTTRWSDYDVVGFTSSFEQNIASLALAQAIKQRHPRIVTVFGGANWEGEMGVALHASFPFVDYVCSGEAEQSFPALLDRLRGGGTGVGVPGVTHRQGSRSIASGPRPPIRDLDQWPMPDFSDYFSALDRTGAATAAAPILLCETSRGCWWGMRSHCTFCGLNGGTMSYRSKSPARAVAEFRYLAETWGIDFVEVVDNILDVTYFDTVLAQLSELGLPLRLFYEVKANLRRWQVRRLKDAGVVRIQPGIESLDDRILKLMGKGSTALRNVQLLKWCKVYGIVVDWNMLYGFPGETAEDYSRMLRLLPAIRHLDPPSACGPVRLDRFSPYFEHPGAYGIRNVRPFSAYHHLYPFAPERVASIAYSFDFDCASGMAGSDAVAGVVDFVTGWTRNPEPGCLWQTQLDADTIVLVDTRAGRQRQFRLAGPDRAVYQFCDEVRPIAAIRQLLRAKFPNTAFSTAQLVESLNSLVENHLMLSVGTTYLSLALYAPEQNDEVEDYVLKAA
jgi:ribosomal peptide maturation radical SAM protein 1